MGLLLGLQVEQVGIGETLCHGSPRGGFRRVDKDRDRARRDWLLGVRSDDWGRVEELATGTGVGRRVTLTGSDSGVVAGGLIVVPLVLAVPLWRVVAIIIT